MKLPKKAIAVVAVLATALVFVGIIIVFFVLRDRNTLDTQNSQLGQADDSVMALQIPNQPYDLEDNSPTFDMYAEVGYDLNDLPQVLLTLDYGPEAEPCTSSDSFNSDIHGYDPNNGECVELGRDKTTLPNHATVQIYTSYYKEDYRNGGPINYSAYAFLPDGSVVSISDDTKLQVNFYDNETRLVQMSGEAYYRVKQQAEGHKFTVQTGDKLIDLSDAELVVNMVNDSTANKKDQDELAKLENKKKKEDSLDADTEARLKANNYEIEAYIVSGAANIRTRGSNSNDTISIDGESPYQMFKFKDYSTRTTSQPGQEELAEAQKSFLKYSRYITNQMKFSVASYGIGNFNSISLEDLYTMLMVRFDGVETYSYNYSMAYVEDMNSFNNEWNSFISKISKCKDGWYKATSTKCCPNDYVLDEQSGVCTKTIYYSTCNEGWTLGTDNMCHKQVSVGQNGGDEDAKAPTYYPSSGSDRQCVNKSKPASYQLCSAAVDIGSAHMEGSQCCFDIDVPEPQMEMIK